MKLGMNIMLLRGHPIFQQPCHYGGRVNSRSGSDPASI